MGNPARSLSSAVSWLRVLPALGIQVPTGLLPTMTTCPLCRGESLQVLGDQVLGGEWVHCGLCGFAGDLIELASRVWGLEIPATVVRLGDLDLLAEQASPERVEGYLRDHVRYRQRLNRFWQEAQRQITKPTAYPLRELIRRFGFLDQILSPMWPQGAGQLVGSADYRQIQQVFHPESYAPRLRGNPHGSSSARRGAGPGAYRMFAGRGWGDVLVLPFYDLPGRIAGLLCIGRDADPAAGDIVFKAANYQATSISCREAGVGMWAAAEQKPHRIFRDTLFVFSDPLIALRLQGQNARESAHPLPIILSHIDARARTEAALAHFSGRPLVFWGRDPLLLKQARAVDGLVSTYVLSDREIAKGLRHHEPADWLRLILKHARPWRIVLAEQLRNCDFRAAEGMLARMDFSPEELRRFIAHSDPALRERLQRCNPLRIACRKIVVGGKSIVETTEGWVIERTRESICNAPIRIEQVVTTSAGEVFYRGIAQLAGEDHAFTVPKAEVDQRGLLSCVFSLLLHSSAGVLQFLPQWDRQAAFIAMQMGQPRAVTGIDRIGWHPKERRFVFPRFSITPSGKVCSDGAPILVDNPPAADLLEPYFRPFIPEELEALCAGRPEVSLFWALGAAILHNLLAPAMNHKPAGILLVGEGAQVAGPTLAKAMGCVEVDIRRPARGQSVLERLNVACARHGWPTLLSVPQGRFAQVTAEWAEAPGPKNAILTLKDYAALSLGTNVGFHVISSSEPAAPLDALRRAAAKLVPAYLLDVCSRKFWMDLTAVRMQDILNDLADWFRREGGDPAAVCSVGNVLHIGGQQPWRLFVELVFRLYAGGHLNLVQDGFQPRHPAVPTIVYRSAPGTMPPSYSVPVGSLNQLLGRLGAPGINLSKILDSLKDVPEFLGANETGWLFEAGWWTARYHEHCGQGCETQEACGAPDAITSG
jgi:hypothetical protein